ncbi:hypothetical protein H7U19_03855 [Hyunsoonleella sp. SJ7]|uniref:Uncharacterized protein n=1 Tax=Hyunsoonleella aquatilis TaxID=2762758 RepID=A0A923KJK9_9FLAO|nr:hypothetical protein [Hyunsoonleella aquatilis]MBC3757522.1 hypothetical protein [Hyunsoonleella aquatilis]
MKNKFLLLNLFYSISLMLNAQVDTIYIDENGSRISKAIYYNKGKSKLYYGERFITDTLVVEKLKLSYYFGKLEPEVKSQLFKLFHNRNNIDTSKVLIIHYNDTLKNPKDYVKNKELKFMYSFGHEHYNNYKGFIRAHKQCRKRNNVFRKIAHVCHFFGFNDGHPNEFRKQLWYKDYGLILKKLFFSGYVKANRMIIRPNGEFFIGYYNNFIFKGLVEENEWINSRNLYIDELNKLNSYK